MVKSKLPPRSDSSLEAVEPHPQKSAIKFFFLLSMVSKVFQKLVNNRIVDHLKKWGLFSDLQYGFRSSRSTADLLTVVSDRTAVSF